MSGTSGPARKSGHKAARGDPHARGVAARRREAPRAAAPAASASPADKAHARRRDARRDAARGTGGAPARGGLREEIAKLQRRLDMVEQLVLATVLLVVIGAVGALVVLL